MGSGWNGSSPGVGDQKANSEGSRSFFLKKVSLRVFLTFALSGAPSQLPCPTESGPTDGLPLEFYAFTTLSLFSK